MEYKLVIGIISCKKYTDNQDVIRNTWLKNYNNPNIDIYFVIGDGNNDIVDDTIELDCKDNYEDLPAKIISFIKFCYNNFEYDYLFKIDDDCYVNFENLEKLDLFDIDYSGHVINKRSFDPQWHVGKCTDEELNNTIYNGKSINNRCSGPGYVLSNYATRVIIDNYSDYDVESELYEDKLIADILADNEIYPVTNKKILYPNILYRNHSKYCIIHLDNSKKGLIKRMLKVHYIITNQNIEGFSKNNNNVLIILILVALAIYNRNKLFNNSNTFTNTSLD